MKYIDLHGPEPVVGDLLDIEDTAYTIISIHPQVGTTLYLCDNGGGRLSEFRTTRDPEVLACLAMHAHARKPTLAEICRGMLDEDDVHTEAAQKMHPGWNVDPARTGRFSCKEPNIREHDPYAAKEMFKDIPEGYTFIDADYSQIELRIMNELIAKTPPSGLKEKAWGTGILREILKVQVIMQQSEKLMAELMLKGMFVDQAYVDDLLKGPPTPMKVDPTVKEGEFKLVQEKPKPGERMMSVKVPRALPKSVELNRLFNKAEIQGGAADVMAMADAGLPISLKTAAAYIGVDLGIDNSIHDSYTVWIQGNRYIAPQADDEPFPPDP